MVTSSEEDDVFARDVLRAAAEQIERFPPAGATNCDARLDGLDLVIGCTAERFPGGRVAYRVEAVPRDASDRASRIGWAGTVVANWKEALEAADALSPGPPDSDGTRWLPD
ncbi:hypothetical protein OM076_00880 [Solirubrobacter ginsenosidimutans]|uniref:Uncharacterized protein n=1 Tax=Solirubrobacter ginsenosidimutans TaxID=490573 RepID=A0A9X3MMD6_9ACTN|nr:hypothetical protein [Solirubrobacter ginsenosidimutans]MDA0158802.1 hypothetical protein [Solirubrobacter ginsenosidimutans]